MPTGDTVAALAGMKSGDADLWWPYVKTVVGSAFRSDFPGINCGIGNSGARRGRKEDVDSDDPHMHMTVRGLFGIEPVLDEGRIDICPAFPSHWQACEIRTPDVSYTYQKDGDLRLSASIPRNHSSSVSAQYHGSGDRHPGRTRFRSKSTPGPDHHGPGTDHPAADPGEAAATHRKGHGQTARGR